jgi:two-component system sensor histidine kinase RegB
MTSPSTRLSLRERALEILRPEIAGTESSSRQALQRLLLLRLLVTLLSLAGAGIFHTFSPLNVSVLFLLAVVAGIAASIAFGYWRLRHATLISQKELFAQLVLDAAFLIVLLLYTGGASNPLISYLLVLLAVGATLLVQRYVTLYSIGSILVYTLFLLSELQNEHSDHMMANFQLHLVGMWVTFVLSAVLITLFVTRMAAAIRSREVTLAKARENEMRNEQLVAIGTLAAGTAHALGTPLSTMSVLLTDLDKLSAEELKNIPLKEDITLLRQQVMRCKDSLSQLTQFYNKSNKMEVHGTLCAELIADIRDYIVNIHPRARVQFNVDPASGALRIAADLSLRHAVINLIENAIKAARADVIVACRPCSGDREGKPCIEISIQDDGPGIPASVMENMGEPFISTRKDSMGLGIFLANAAIQRLSGSIEMFNRKSGGAMSIVRLPVAAPTSDAAAAVSTGGVS